MYKPLLLELDYKVINNASGQILRAFWENVNPEEYEPTIICCKRESPFVSKWPLIEFPDSKFLHMLGYALKKIRFPDPAIQPDMYYPSWGKRTLKNIDSILEEGQFDFIHSVSCPFATHLVALEIKKRTGLPWIAQFHDPWIDNSSNQNRIPFFKNRFAKMEYEIANNADYIIHTNDVIVDTWKKRYGSLIDQKIVALPLSFNTKHLPDREKTKRNDKIVISHIGEIYESRSIKDLVDAMKDILSFEPVFADKIVFKLVGRVSDVEKQYVNQNKLENLFQFVGLLPPDKLGQFYKESDYFLALDINIVKSSSFPSKLMMYHYYQKQIIGITRPGSIMESELKKSGHTVCYYGQKEQIKSFIKLAASNNTKVQLEFDHEYWRQYTVEHAIDLYTAIVEKVLS